MKALIFGMSVLALAACKEEPHKLTAAEQSTAELGARQYFDAAGLEFVSCSGQDSPPVDGYVTCTGKSADNKLTEAACSYAEGAKGCKQK